MDDETKSLEKLHWGGALHAQDVSSLSHLTLDNRPEASFSGIKHAKLLEFGDYGTGDFRSPSFGVEYSTTGSRSSPLRFVSFSIVEGKPNLERDDEYPLPALQDGEDWRSLQIELEDDLTGFKTHLWYHALLGTDVIVRRSIAINHGTEDVTLTSLNSATLDFPVARYGKIGRSPAHVASLSLSLPWCFFEP